MSRAVAFLLQYWILSLLQPSGALELLLGALEEDWWG